MFAPLEALVPGQILLTLELDVDDDAVQWVNELLETMKLLLLTMVSPVNWLTAPP